MAEGFTRALHPDIFRAVSAGIEEHGMNPRTIQVMMEAGIDISGQCSKSIGDLESQDFDIVITVCDHAQEVCPVLPVTVRSLHRSFKDPAITGSLRDEEAIISVYRQVRDEIRDWVAGLPEELSG